MARDHAGRQVAIATRGEPRGRPVRSTAQGDPGVPKGREPEFAEVLRSARRAGVSGRSGQFTVHLRDRDGISLWTTTPAAPRRR